MPRLSFICLRRGDSLKYMAVFVLLLLFSFYINVNHASLFCGHLLVILVNIASTINDISLFALFLF